MRKIFLALLLIGFSFALGYTFFRDAGDRVVEKNPFSQTNKPILRFALIADSHSDNANLEKALTQAQGFGINFVIGLGDWTTVGTLDELSAAKKAFDQAKIPYYLTVGDHDLWDSRNHGEDPLLNFRQVFGQPNREIMQGAVQIVILDNSDIYLGIRTDGWNLLTDSLSSGTKSEDQNAGNSKLETRNSKPKLRLVMAHKTPFHPDSKHVMGEDSAEVEKQAGSFLSLLTQSKVGGFFSGDLHFFAKFQDPSETVKITTVGAVTKERNFQGPRFAIVTVFDDYTWEVEDVEIR